MDIDFMLTIDEANSLGQVEFTALIANVLYSMIKNETQILKKDGSRVSISTATKDSIAKLNSNYVLGFISNYERNYSIIDEVTRDVGAIKFHYLD